MTHHHNDTRTVKIADSPVMGRLPVLVLATFLAIAALGQLKGAYASKTLAAYSGGHDGMYVAWSGTLIVAAVVVWIGRFHSSPAAGAIFEVAGILLIALALAAYLIALWHYTRFDGTGIIWALAVSSLLNILGRALLLIRRDRELRKAIQ